ncbi:MAG: N-acetylmuramoyl-L-alanine amidase, partial [Gaiella sp.]
RRTDGRWSSWFDVHAEGTPTTDPRGRLRGWTLGEGIWVGTSTRLEVRTSGRIVRLRAHYVRSRTIGVPLRTTTAAGAPAIVTRSTWRADETLRRAEPEVAPAVGYAVVHHTAGVNGYTRAQSPAIVRAIMAYHVQANGWNDIGYNALVDRYGTVYEGRYGGVDANVVGAHAKGFNTGSFGIALMGEFDTTEPTAASLESLARTVAWRLDLAHVDPLTTFDVVSSGSDRFPAGVPVFLRAVSGHRDTGFTACPGAKLYALLPSVARRVAAIGLPKLYDAAVEGTFGQSLAFSARLSAALPWTVSVVERASGGEVARIRGRGTNVAAIWDTTGVTPGVYDWTIEAPGVTPATGSLDTLAAGLSLAFGDVVVDPAVVSPDGDGTLDTATLRYTLSAPANVSAVVVDATGSELATIVSPVWRRAGEHEAVVDAVDLPDGTYEIRLLARGSGGREATRVVPLAVTRTLGRVALRNAVVTPNGDGRSDRLGVRFTLAAPARVRLRVLRGDAWVATAFEGRLGAGRRFLEWDALRRGVAAGEGAYTAVLEATDELATARVELPFVADGTPPQVVLVSLAPPRLRVSEPARLDVRVNGGTQRRIRVAQAGVITLPGVARLRSVRVVARDERGNIARVRLP